MRKELGLLNIICILVALGFLVMAVISVISSGDFLTIDNLFIITVSLVMALMFAINPLLYLKSEGACLAGMKKVDRRAGGGGDGARSARTAPPLLDAKGRAVPQTSAPSSHDGSPQRAQKASRLDWSEYISYLPHLNACLNATSACCCFRVTHSSGAKCRRSSCVPGIGARCFATLSHFVSHLSLQPRHHAFSGHGSSPDLFHDPDSTRSSRS
jgi:hypothetical protein